MSLEPERTIDHKELQRFFYTSPEATKIYLKTAYLVMLKAMEWDNQEFKIRPLTPPTMFKSMCHLPVSDAQLVFETVLKSYGFTEEELQKHMKGFNRMISKDCYQRLLDQKLYQ